MWGRGGSRVLRLLLACCSAILGIWLPFYGPGWLLQLPLSPPHPKQQEGKIKVEGTTLLLWEDPEVVHITSTHPVV